MEFGVQFFIFTIMFVLLLVFRLMDVTLTCISNDNFPIICMLRRYARTIYFCYSNRFGTTFHFDRWKFNDAEDMNFLILCIAIAGDVEYNWSTISQSFAFIPILFNLLNAWKIGAQNISATLQQRLKFWMNLT